MKHYAIVTDVIRDEPFGVVVKEGTHNICHGFHEAGYEWADLYNTGAVKALHDGLPPGVELGDFGPLPLDTEDLLNKSPQDIPVPKTFHLVESEWLENDSLGPAIKDVGLREMPQESRQLAIDYKAHAFLVESSRSSTLLAVRLGGGGFTPDGTGFRSKTAARHEFSHLALGNSHTRRIAKDVLNGKMLILSQPYRFTDVPETDIVTKALGAKLGGNLARGGRRARRAAQIFDPNAIDADMDLMVQEGTPWERPLMRKPNLPGLPGTARSRAADRTPEARTTAARAVRDRRGLRSTRDLRGDMPDEGIDLSPAQERLIGRLRDDTLDTTLGDLYSDPTTPTSVTNAIENFTGLDKDDTDPIWNQKLSDISDTTSANILDLMEADVHGDPEKYFGQRHTRGLASVTDISNSHMKEGETSKFPGPGMIGPEMHRRLGILRDNGFHIYKGDGNNYKIVPPDRVRNAHRLQALRGREGSNPKAFDAAIEEIAAELGVRPEQLDVGNDAHWKIIGDKKRGYADLDFLGMRQGRTDARSMMSFHADSTESVLINAQKNWLRLIVGNDPDDNDVRLGDDLILGNLEDIARTGEGPLGYIPQESMRRAPRGVGGKEKLWSPVERPIGGSETQRRDFNEAARNIAIAGARRDLDAAEVMWREARDEDRKGRTPRTAALRAEASRLLQEEQDKLTDLESRWTDPTGGGRGPKSRGPDPEDFDAFWNQAREESDNHVAGLLDSVSEELGQAEPDFEKIKASHVEVLDAIDIARKKGLRSVLRDGDDDYTPDPDRWHDDPFERDRAINSSIFGDRMDGMSIDNAAEKYGVNRHEVRSREIEHLEELAGQERYNAQPNLNQRIFDDRMSGMSLEDAAKKYDVDRIEIRAREVTHSNALGGQERYNVQPNLNQRIYRDRMQGLSLDEVGRRYAMDRDEVRSREITHMGSDGRGLRSEGSKPEVDAAKPEVDAAKTAELNRRIDTLRKSKLQPWVDRVEEAKERGDDKATHSLTKELRGFQEEEAELREQLGEAMGKGRVAIGLRSQRATEDWDADWATAREESITEMTELGEQLAGELKKSKTDRKKINDLTDKISGSIEKARERGLASKGPGKPWQRPEPDSTNSFGTDGPPKDWARAKRAMDLHSNWEMYPPSDGPGYSPKSRHWGDDDVEILGRLRTGNMDAEIIRGENTGEDGFVIVGMFRDPDSAVNAAEYFDSGVSSFRTTTEAQKWLDDFDKRLANDLDPWGDDEIPAPDAVGKARGLRSQRLRQGDKVTVNHRGEDVEGTVVRFGRGGASGVGTDSYVVSIPGEQRSIWKRPDEILEGPDSERGLRSRGNDPSYEGPSPAEERGFDALMDRVDKTPIGELYDMDELSSRSNRLLDDLITEHGWDVEEDGADVGKTLAELLPGRGKIGDSRSKFLAEVESDFWDDPSKFVDLGPGPPDPYDVMVEDRMGGLRSRTRAATTERAATRRGLASRKADERTLSGIYRGDSPRQSGTADGKIWDTLSADGGMTPERTQAIADAAAALEQDLMSGTGTPGKRLDQSVSLAGTNADKAGTSWEWVMRPAIADLMFGDESRVGDVPPASEWRLGELTGDIDTDIAGIEDILQNQVVRIGAGSENTVAHKRKLLDSLAVLAHMRKSGNYEALEQLHPKHRARLLEKAREIDQTIPEKVKAGAGKSSIFGAVGGYDSVEAFKNEMKGRTRSRKGRTPGAKRGTRRERMGEEAQRLTGAIRGEGGPAAWLKRRREAEQLRRAATGTGAPRRVWEPAEKPDYKKGIQPHQRKEQKKSAKIRRKLGRQTFEKRLGRIRDKREKTFLTRQADTPLEGAATSRRFQGPQEGLQGPGNTPDPAVVDVLHDFEDVENAPEVTPEFISRMAHLAQIWRREETEVLEKNATDTAGREATGEDKLRQMALHNAWVEGGHAQLPEVATAEEIQSELFEPVLDGAGNPVSDDAGDAVYQLREGVRPVHRGMGDADDGAEGEAFYQQWIGEHRRFVPGEGGQGHKAGENHAELAVVPTQNGVPIPGQTTEVERFGLARGKDYGNGPLSFITPETRVVGWRKLLEIRDEGTTITKALEGDGLHEVETPNVSIKEDRANFAGRVRDALDKAHRDGKLTTPKRTNDRTPHNPENPPAQASGVTGSGFGLNEVASGSNPLRSDWRDTMFGSMVDQFLEHVDSPDSDIDPEQLHQAWEHLMKMMELTNRGGSNDTYLFDLLPILGFAAVQRHGGVVSVSNRSAVITLDTSVRRKDAVRIIERLAKRGKLDQASLKALLDEKLARAER